MGTITLENGAGFTVDEIAERLRAALGPGYEVGPTRRPGADLLVRESNVKGALVKLKKRGEPAQVVVTGAVPSMALGTLLALFGVIPLIYCMVVASGPVVKQTEAALEDG